MQIKPLIFFDVFFKMIHYMDNFSSLRPAELWSYFEEILKSRGLPERKGK